MKQQIRKKISSKYFLQQNTKNSSQTLNAMCADAKGTTQQEDANKEGCLKVVKAMRARVQEERKE